MLPQGGAAERCHWHEPPPPVLSSAPNNYTWGLHARGVPRKSPGRGPGSGGHFQHLLAMGGSNVGPTTEGLGKISAGPGNVVTGAGAQEIAQRQGATLRGNGHDRERKIAQGLTGHKRRKCWDFVNRKRSGAGSGPASEFGYPHGCPWQAAGTDSGRERGELREPPGWPRGRLRRQMAGRLSQAGRPYCRSSGYLSSLL